MNTHIEIFLHLVCRHPLADFLLFPHCAFAHSTPLHLQVNHGKSSCSNLFAFFHEERNLVMLSHFIAEIKADTYIKKLFSESGLEGRVLNHLNEVK